jgi:hypothetical protein
MKNILLILSLFGFSLSVADELKWVDEQIQAIKPPRIGITKSNIDMIEDPFIFLKKQLKEKSTTKALRSNKNAMSKQNRSKSVTNTISEQTASFSLGAIINKSALINGRWYELHSKIGRYTLSNIDTTSVILSYKNKELLLTTRAKIKKLKFKNN